jgi:hypothetical protein
MLNEFLKNSPIDRETIAEAAAQTKVEAGIEDMQGIAAVREDLVREFPGLVNGYFPGPEGLTKRCISNTQDLPVLVCPSRVASSRTEQEARDAL